MAKKEVIFDPVRHQKVQETPEEKVRQQVISWLHHELKIPYESMECEVPLKRLGFEGEGRIDLAVVNGWNHQKAKVWLLVECKRPGIPLGIRLNEQMSRYLSHGKSLYVMTTNGVDVHFYKHEPTEMSFYKEINTIPYWNS